MVCGLWTVGCGSGSHYTPDCEGFVSAGRWAFNGSAPYVRLQTHWCLTRWALVSPRSNAHNTHRNSRTLFTATLCSTTCNNRIHCPEYYTFAYIQKQVLTKRRWRSLAICLQTVFHNKAKGNNWVGLPLFSWYSQSIIVKKSILKILLMINYMYAHFCLKGPWHEKSNLPWSFGI